MSTITWLHLSDLHLRAGDRHTWDADVVLPGLLQDLRERIVQDGLSPDLILVSGDVAFSGATAEYALTRAFFDDLLTATGLQKEQLFAVPGNHEGRARGGIESHSLNPGIRCHMLCWHSDMTANQGEESNPIRSIQGFVVICSSGTMI
jgi:3',5'-cyclic AMP phosphodiesterase CpdA